MKDTVDVIIPVYNSAKFVLRAIRSIQNQTHAPEKIIVIDDCSSDSTVSIIEKEINISSIPLILIKSNENHGPSRARNIGIKASSAKYIAFLDADDLWEEDKLEKQIEVFQSSKVNELGIVYCKYFFVNEKDQRLDTISDINSIVYHNGNIKKYLREKKDFICNPCLVLVLRSALLDVDGFDEDLRYGEDWDLFFRLSEKYNFDYVDEYLVRIRDHEENTTKNILYNLWNSIVLYDKYSNLPIVTHSRENLIYYAYKYDKKDELRRLISGMGSEMRHKYFPIIGSNIMLYIVFYAPKWIVKSILLRISHTISRYY